MRILLICLSVTLTGCAGLSINGGPANSNCYIEDASVKSFGISCYKNGTRVSYRYP